jgi:hypothetical protein
VTGAVPFAIIGLGAIMGGGGIMGAGAMGIMGGPDIGGIMGAGAGLMMTISAGERLMESITLGFMRVARPAPTRASSSANGDPFALGSLL